MPEQMMMGRERAYAALTGHRHWSYRGCAPDADNAGVCQGDGVTPLSVMFTPEGEPQKDRAAREAAAKAVCGGCPVVAACAAYALGPVGGRLNEDSDMWGGLTAHERHEIAASRRSWLQWTPEMVVPQEQAAHAQTVQRTVLLVALAGNRDPEKAARAAGMDVRTANWQRARLVSLLELDPNRATRVQLLRAARANGLLPAGVGIVPDGPYPLAAIPVRQHRVCPRPRLLVLPGMADTGPYRAPDRAVKQAGAGPVAVTGSIRRRNPSTTGGRRGLHLVPAPSYEQLALPPFTPAPPAPRTRPRLELAS